MAADVVLNNAEILQKAARWREQGHAVALATVVDTWGSSPRPVGSLLAANDQQQFVGSVSGGCIEAAVIEQARRTMDEGKPQLLEFGVSNELAWEVGLACGGQVKVYVENLE